ncbi:MAG: hypothetical protein FWG30_04725 [Eubacteriaceae bacterium]|nr:hypothetical protein [Eubacteriaceae bacterium]
MDNIAIIGMGCLYPNYITAESFWKKLIDAETLTSKVDFYGKTIERARLPADESDEFFKGKFSDDEFAELDELGDLFKWTAYICDAALKDSGYYGNSKAMERTGLTLGIFGLPSKEVTPFFADPMKISTEQAISTILARDDFNFEFTDESNLDTRALISDTEPSVYVAGKHRLGGPILNLNAACSSPVYSMKLASYYLMSGKADLMLAGAHCYNQLEEAVSSLLELLGLLEDAGSCKPFDRNSKGAVGGSGAGMFVLKRLEDAVRDGDKIYAVIEAIGWSNDGNGKAILAPDATGQMLAYMDAYKDGADPNIDYLECHATGTLAGDLVELYSINSFFGKRDASPMLGAHKGATGHFFTASTHAGISKVLLSMQNGIIPKTVNVENPANDKVLVENTEWVKKGAYKRAAVNSFGFGGTNGHLILREYDATDPTNKESRKELSEDESMAVVGIGMHIGDMTTTESFYKAMLSNSEMLKEPADSRWTFPISDPRTKNALKLDSFPKGTYLNSYEFDYLKFKLPAKGNQFLMRKDFLALDAASQAIEEAGISVGTNPKTAVLINISQDYSELNFSVTLELKESIEQSLRNSWPFLDDSQVAQIMEIMRDTERIRDTPDSVTGIIPSIKASRIASHWGFKGPVMAMMNGETGFARSLEIAQYLLSQDIVETVVVGSIELTGEIENVYVQQLRGNMGKYQENGLCEGAVSFVLKKPQKAVMDNNHIYGTIDAVSITGSSLFSSISEQLSSSLSELMPQAADSSIGYVEMPLSAPAQSAKALSEILEGKYRQKFEKDEFVESSVERFSGMSRGLSDAVALAKHMLMLSNKMKFVESEGRHFTWSLLNSKRSSLINSFGSDSSVSHILLSEYHAKPQPASLVKPDAMLVPIFAPDLGSLAILLDEIEAKQTKREIMPAINAAWESYSNKSDGGITLCLIAENKETFLSELNAAKNAIASLSSNKGNKSWESKKGSFIATDPIGSDAGIVCMFPPGERLNSAKFFETLLRFPDLRDFYELYINGPQLAGRGLKGAFVEGNTMELAEVRVGLGILKEKLGVAGDYYIGASMGEFSILLATDAISAAEGSDEYFKILEDFYGLVAYMHEVDPTQEGLLPNAPSSWASYYFSGDTDELLGLLDSEPLAFASIIGSPRDAIATGDGEAMARVIERFSGIATKTIDSPASHTPAAKAVYSQTPAYSLGAALSFKPGTPFVPYEGFYAKPIDTAKADLIDEIKYIFTETVDFRSMLEDTYAKGARLYINTSANPICSLWAENSFRNRNALCISAYPSIYAPEEHYIRTAAKLISHGYDANAMLSMFKTPDIDAPSFVGTINMSMQHYLTDEQDMLAAPRETLSRIFEEAEGVRPAGLEASNIRQQSTMQAIRAAIPDANSTPGESAKEGEALQTEQVIAHEQESQDKKIPVPSSIGLPIAARDNAAQTSQNAPLSLPMGPLYARLGMRAIADRANAYSLYLSSEAKILDSIVRKMRSKNEIASQSLPAKRECLWDLDDILSMTTESMAKTLGPQYEKVDTYFVRARMPLPPFLFVSRITKIDAEFGELKPAYIEFEYDVTKDTLFATEDQVSYITCTESAQIGIFLVAYMGIDEIYDGKVRFRIADSNCTLFSDLPRIGETFRGEYKITSFLKSGGSTLVISIYNVYIGDRLVLTLNSIGGFFSDQDLDSAKGVAELPMPVFKAKERTEPYVPIPIANKAKSSYSDEEVNEYYKGNVDAFLPQFDMEELKGAVGDDYLDPQTPEFQQYLSEALPSIQLINRIVSVDPTGGEYGYGEIITEQDIDADYWVFKVHFPNDPVYPGSILLETINQSQFFLFLLTGNVLKAKNRIVQPIPKNTVKSSFRGQIKPMKSTIRFKVTIREIDEAEEGTIFTIDARVYWQGMNVGKADGFKIILG